jgi:hypothetical protein
VLVAGRALPQPIRGILGDFGAIDSLMPIADAAGNLAPPSSVSRALTRKGVRDLVQQYLANLLGVGCQHELPTQRYAAVAVIAQPGATNRAVKAERPANQTVLNKKLAR